MEQKRKIEIESEIRFTVGHVLFEPVTVQLRYNKLPITTGMMSTSNFFKNKILICLICSRFRTESYFFLNFLRVTLLTSNCFQYL